MAPRATSFYIATGLRNVEVYSTVRSILVTALGWRQTFDWLAHGKAYDFAERAIDDLWGVLEADVVIVILPGGRGTHFELGAALAMASIDMNKEVILWAPGGLVKHNADSHECVFHHHPRLHLIEAEEPAALISDLLNARGVRDPLPEGQREPQEAAGGVSIDPEGGRSSETSVLTEPPVSAPDAPHTRRISVLPRQGRLVYFEGEVCPSCGSMTIIDQGYRFTCTTCGGRFNP